MQIAALRALEFDRIVDAVRAFCADPDGRRTPRRAGAVRGPAPRRAPPRGDDRGRAVSREKRRAGPSGERRPAVDSRIAGGRGARARRPAAAHARDVSRLGGRHAGRDPARRRFVPADRTGRGRRSVVQGRDRAGPRQDRRGGRRRRSCEPGTEDDSRPAAQAADAAARDARVVPARQGHREVPAGSGRHRAKRPLRAGRASPNIAAASRASSTARRRAARACISNRSAPSRSTTTSSRSRSRRPRKCGASCWR